PLVVAHPFDLHVLGPPQTFALSQDQTLQFECSALSGHVDRIFWTSTSPARWLTDAGSRGASPCELAFPPAFCCAERHALRTFSASSSSLQFSGGELVGVTSGPVDRAPVAGGSRWAPPTSSREAMCTRAQNTSQ